MQNLFHHADTPELISTKLESFLQEAIDNAQAIHPDYARLWQTIQSLSTAGGKRLRPQMTILAYEAFGGNDTQSIIPVAVAQELLHLGLLVHDDIIDRDDIRYGVSNITGSYMQLYAPHVSDPHVRRHYSQGAAILGGDLLLSGAYQCIAASELSDTLKIKATSLLSAGIFEVCGGELLDTEGAFKEFEKTDALLIARYKTASYSFITPLVTGAALAGATEQQRMVLSKYSEILGIAYQLTDDIIGCFGDEETTGKSSRGDIREGKHTYLIEKYLEITTVEQTDAFWDVFGNPHATHEEIDHLKDAIAASGAKELTEQYVRTLSIHANELISEMNVSVDKQATFKALIDKATNRTF